MSNPTLAELVTVVTYDDVLGTELSIAASLGFPTSAWQPVSVDRTTLAINAELAANLSTIVNLMAQGSYASYAALMVDQAGLPITTWMDLRGQDQYNVTRLPATYAATPSSGFAVTNSSGTSYGSFAPGQLHFQNASAPNQPAYTNAATVTILPHATTPIAIVADLVGAASSSGPGTITTMLTPLVGCTCTNSAAVVGLDAETNAHYLQRCQTKLGTLSPNGPAQAYYFVATSILDPTQRFYNAALSEAITRADVISAPALVKVYIANATATEPGGDLAIVSAAIQAWCVPSGTTAIVYWATPVTINVTYTAYVPASSGLTSIQITTAVSTALALYFQGIPVGGLTDASSGIVPYSGILGTIYSTIAKLTPTIGGVTLTVPAADVAIAPTAVPKLGVVSGSVVFTS